MRNPVECFAELPTIIRKPLWRWWHRYLMKIVPAEDVAMLNYGYAELDETPSQNGEGPDTGDERYGENLYYQTVVEIGLHDQEVLEVGCGRGGGAKHLVKMFSPKRYVATDLSPDTTRYNNEQNGHSQLEFAVADAMDLPFKDAEFDILVNVESSRCYPDMHRFVNDAYRVIRPGGTFCLADMRYAEDFDPTIQIFLNAGFQKMSERDITANVIHALNLDDERRKALIAMRTPKYMVKNAEEFSGTIGSKRYNLFADGDMVYKIIHFRKPELNA